jgi:pyruvate ferredoxin oxidoreductase beta subunit
MATKLTPKELAKRPERLAPGHRLCAGCGASIVVRQMLAAIDDPVVIANATGCLEVGTTIYPYTAWRVPWIHNAFENAASTISGVEAAYRSMVRQGKIPEQDVKFLAFAGDGGTYDIGIQALSGAVERGHQFLYVCYDNGAYMNTGIQRSSATPFGANTTTSPAGKVIPGKKQFRKDLTAIMAAHGIPYVAQGGGLWWAGLYERAFLLQPGLAAWDGRDGGDHPAGGRLLLLAPLRGGGQRMAADLQAQGKEAGGGVAEATREVPPPLPA